jgi:hypothetical protein
VVPTPTASLLSNQEPTTWTSCFFLASRDGGHPGRLVAAELEALVCLDIVSSEGHVARLLILPNAAEIEFVDHLLDFVVLIVVAIDRGPRGFLQSDKTQ